VMFALSVEGAGSTFTIASHLFEKFTNQSALSGRQINDQNIGG